MGNGAGDKKSVNICSVHVVVIRYLTRSHVEEEGSMMPHCLRRDSSVGMHGHRTMRLQVLLHLSEVRTQRKHEVHQGYGTLSSYQIIPSSEALPPKGSTTFQNQFSQRPRMNE